MDVGFVIGVYNMVYLFDIASQIYKHKIIKTIPKQTGDIRIFSWPVFDVVARYQVRAYPCILRRITTQRRPYDGTPATIIWNARNLWFYIRRCDCGFKNGRSYYK